MTKLAISLRLISIHMLASDIDALLPVARRTPVDLTVSTILEPLDQAGCITLRLTTADDDGFTITPLRRIPSRCVHDRSVSLAHTAISRLDRDLGMRMCRRSAGMGMTNAVLVRMNSAADDNLGIRCFRRTASVRCIPLSPVLEAETLPLSHREDAELVGRNGGHRSLVPVHAVDGLTVAEEDTADTESAKNLALDVVICLLVPRFGVIRRLGYSDPHLDAGIVQNRTILDVTDRSLSVVLQTDNRIQHVGIDGVGESLTREPLIIAIDRPGIGVTGQMQRSIAADVRCCLDLQTKDEPDDILTFLRRRQTSVMAVTRLRIIMLMRHRSATNLRVGVLHPLPDILGWNEHTTGARHGCGESLTVHE